MKPDPLAAIPSTGKKTNLTDRLPMPDYIGGMKHGRYNRYHEPRRYGGGRPRRGGRSSSFGGYVAGALLVGVTAGTGWLFTMPEGRQAFMTSANDIAVSAGMMRERAP